MSPDHPEDGRHAPLQSPRENVVRMYEAIEAAHAEPGWLVVLGRHGKPVEDARLVQHVADGLGTDSYTIQQWFRMPGPRIIRREPYERRARRWADWLNAMNLRAFAVGEAHLAAFHPVPVVFFEHISDSVVFHTADGQMLSPRQDFAFCLVGGTVTRREVVEREASDLWIGSVGAASETRNAEIAHVLDMHFARDGLVVRLDSRQLDFRRFFPNQQVAIENHFRSVRSNLLEAYPHVRVLESFDACRAALSEGPRASGKQDSFHLALGRPGLSRIRQTKSHSYEMDEQAAFDRYSALSRFDELANA